MRVTSLRAMSLACCALSSVLVTVACGGSGSDGKGTSGASAAAGTSSSGATGGTGGTSGGAGGAGATGGGGGTTGGTSGGTAGGMSSGGATGGAMSAGGTGGGTGGSTMAGASGTTGGAGGTGGDGAGGGAGGSAGSPTGGSAGISSGGDAGSAAGGKGGSGGGKAGAVPSPGCGTKPAVVEDGLQHIDVGGTMRDYIIRVPTDYNASQPHRIIYAFHGMSGSADQVDKGDPPNTGLDPTGPYYGIKEHAEPDVIFVAGQALSGGWTNSNGRDIDYVKALVSHLEEGLCIDQRRRLATGFSFGAIMTITVACNLSDMFRAVAPMSGSLQNGCPAGGQSIAYWSSHGSSDTTIAPAKGIEARDEFAKRNGCDAAADTAPVPFGSDGCVAFQGCKDGYPVNWCPFDGIHEPPPFSGPAIWAFLSQF